MNIETAPAKGFDTTGLEPAILHAIQQAGLVIPTPIQAQALPVALAGQDLIGIAQTGTGKTLAFALPIINHLATHKIQKALVLVPTRELALQVTQSIRTITQRYPNSAKSVTLIGGEPIYRQIKELKLRPSIIVATPGRLRDHLEQRTVNLSDVGLLILDEADRMLDMGFAPQINFICQSLPKNRQTMLFSATMAANIATLANNYLKNPVRIEVAKSGSNNNHIQQELCYVDSVKKNSLLNTLLDTHAGTVLVFSRTKHGATKITKKVQDMGHSAAEIHSNRSLGQRRQALDGFRNGRYRVLVATDVASRGIDVPDIALVVNYDLPDAAEDYVHRIGRTGRAERSGRAISFATPDQHKEVRAIEQLVNKTIPLSEHSAPKPVYAPRPSNRPPQRKYGRRGW